MSDQNAYGIYSKVTRENWCKLINASLWLVTPSATLGPFRRQRGATPHCSCLRLISCVRLMVCVTNSPTGPHSSLTVFVPQYLLEIVGVYSTPLPFLSSVLPPSVLNFFRLPPCLPPPYLSPLLSFIFPLLPFLSHSFLSLVFLSLTFSLLQQSFGL